MLNFTTGQRGRMFNVIYNLTDYDAMIIPEDEVISYTVNPSTATSINYMVEGELSTHATNGFNLNNNLTCNLQAGKKVTLLPGFKSAYGSAFNAKISPVSCNAVPANNAKTDEKATNEAELNSNFSNTNSRLIGVYDILGRKVLNELEIGNGNLQDLLHSGVYILVYQKEDGTIFSNKIYTPEN